MSDYRGPFLGLANGRSFYPLDPRPAEVDDICTLSGVLSRICRFGGRCREFYSVAQHSVHVARIVEFTHPQFALHGLLHDVAEVYLGDIVTPIKNGVVVYGERIGEVERRIHAAIWQVHGVGRLNLSADAVVKEADACALATEARDLMGNPNWHGLACPEPKVIVALPPAMAQREFIRVYKELRLAAKRRMETRDDDGCPVNAPDYTSRSDECHTACEAPKVQEQIR